MRRQGANDTEFRALLDVRKNGNRIGTLESGKNSYPAEQQTSNEVGIRTDYLTGEDLFVITDQINPNGTIAFKILVKPLVNLIWLAGIVFLIGSLVALWPSARRAAAARGPLPRAPGVRAGMTAVALAFGAVLACACALFVAPPVPA